MCAPTSPRWTPARGLWLLPCALLGASCSGSLNPVEGRVLVNGRAAKGAVVIFHPEGVNEVRAVRPSAVTREDGSFALTTNTRQGAAVGEYRVTVTWPGEPPPAPKAKTISTAPPESGEAPDRLHGRYANPRTTQLRAVVRKGANRLEPFDLK